MRAIQLNATFFLLALSAAATPYSIQPIVACNTCSSTGVFAISNSGEIGGVTSGPNGTQGFWGRPGDYTLFSVPGASFTEVVGIRDNGTIAGDYFGPEGLRTYQRASDGTLDLLPLLSGAKAQNGGTLNNNGLLVGNIADDPFKPTLVTAYVLQDLKLKETFNIPGAYLTQAHGVNDAGVIVGYSVSSLSPIPKSFIRQPDGTLSYFAIPGSIGSQLYGIDNNGDLAGGYFDSSDIEHGFVVRGGVLTTIDFSGQNSVVFGINDAGEAVGASYATGQFLTGPYAGFLATPTPEPAAWMMVSAGLLAMLFFRVFRAAGLGARAARMPSPQN